MEIRNQVDGPEPLLLTVEEAARMLRIGRSRMFGLIREGEVPSLIVPGTRCRRIPLEALREWLAAAADRNAA